MRAYWIAMLGIEPGIRGELLESERHALFVIIKFQNFYLDLIADIHQIARVGKPSPGHVGDVQQAVDAAEVNECAVFGQVLYYASEDRAFFEVAEQLGALFGLFLLQKLFARNHHVPTLFVQLDDGDVERLPFHRVEVANRAQVDLRAG